MDYDRIEDEVAKSQSDVVVLGHTWLDRIVVSAFIVATVPCAVGIARSTHSADPIDIFYALAMSLGVFLVLGVMAFLVLGIRNRGPLAEPTEHGFAVMSRKPRRATVVPWERVKSVSRWEPSNHRKTTGRTGMLVECASGAIPWRQDNSIRFLGDVEELQRILVAMEKYSGREFRL